jgi:hypothetical protein
VLGVDGAFTGGVGTFIDANGARTPIAPRQVGGGVRWVLDEALLARSAFPATLDPVVSASIPASVSVQAPVGSYIVFAAPEGSGWIAATGEGQSTLVSRLDAQGRAVETAVLPGLLDLFVSTDRFRLVTSAGEASGTSFSELVDGGLAPVPPGLTGVAFPTPLAVAADGLLVAAQLALPDGGAASEVRRLGADLSWDGGGFQLASSLSPTSWAIEGSLAYLVYFDSQAIRQGGMTLKATGEPLAPLTLPDGGALYGLVTSNGTNATALVWNEYHIATDTSTAYAALLSNGAFASPIYDLGFQHGTAIPPSWDGTAFRVKVQRDGGYLDELFLATDGGLSAPSTLAHLRAFDVGPEVYGESAGPSGLLLVWSRGGYDELFATASVLPIGASAPLDPDGGQVLFHAANRVLAPSLAVGGDQAFVVWNDDRVGGHVNELWGRRFTTALQPLDPDAFTTNPEHRNGNTNWINAGPAVAALGDGWIVASCDSFKVRAQRFDSNAQPAGPTAELTVYSLFNNAQVFGNGDHALVLWTDETVHQQVFSIIGADGGQTASGSLASSSFATVVPFETDFALISSASVSRLSLNGALSPLQVGPFPGAIVMGAANDGQHLLIVTQPAPLGPLTAELVDFDGGLLDKQNIQDPDGGVEAASVLWDGRRFYAALLVGLADGGNDLSLLLRHVDGGWTPAVQLDPDIGTGTAVAAVPDAGLLVAHGIPGGPVTLRRVIWVDNGGACGADSDCEAGFCVDGVCCDTACGGGAIDCLACARSLGATLDGTCSVIPAARVCRPAAGACDVAEVCDGVSTVCPPDAHVDAGAVCRAAAGACDAPESCDGVAAACPPDVGLDAGAASCFGPDGGVEGPLSLRVACGCQGAPGALALLAALLPIARRRASRRAARRC